MKLTTLFKSPKKKETAPVENVALTSPKRTSSLASTFRSLSPSKRSKAAVETTAAHANVQSAQVGPSAELFSPIEQSSTVDLMQLPATLQHQSTDDVPLVDVMARIKSDGPTESSPVAPNAAVATSMLLMTIPEPSAESPALEITPPLAAGVFSAVQSIPTVEAVPAPQLPVIYEEDIPPLQANSSETVNQSEQVAANLPPLPIFVTKQGHVTPTKDPISAASKIINDLMNDASSPRTSSPLDESLSSTTSAIADSNPILINLDLDTVELSSIIRDTADLHISDVLALQSQKILSYKARLARTLTKCTDLQRLITATDRRMQELTVAVDDLKHQHAQELASQESLFKTKMDKLEKDVGGKWCKEMERREKAVAKQQLALQADMRTEMESARKTWEQGLEEEKVKLKKEMARMTEELVTAQSLVATLKSRVAQAHEQGKTVASKSVEDEKKAREQTVNELMVQIAELYANKQALEAQLAANGSATDQSSKINELESVIDGLKKEKAAFVAEMKMLRGQWERQITSLNQVFADAKHEMEKEFEDKLGSGEALVGNVLKHKLMAMEKDKQALEQEKQALEWEFEKQEDVIDKLQGDYARLLVEVEQSKNNVTDHSMCSQALERATDETHVAQSELEKVRRDYKRTANELTKLEQEKTKHASEVDSLKGQIASLKLEMDLKKDLDDGNERLVEQMAQAQEELNVLRSTFAQSQDALHQAQLDKISCKEELDLVLKQVKQQSASSLEQRGSLSQVQHVLEATQSKLEVLEQEVCDKDEQVQTLREQVVMLERELASVSLGREDDQHDVTLLKQCMEDVREKMAKLEVERRCAWEEQATMESKLSKAIEGWEMERQRADSGWKEVERLKRLYGIASPSKSSPSKSAGRQLPALPSASPKKSPQKSPQRTPFRV
jgi:chromosome segregation ATPase